MNNISFTGHVVADAEVREAGDNNVLSVRVANNVGFGDKASTNWFKVSYFRKNGLDKLADMLKKGKEVFVSGEFKTTTYTDKNGVTQTSLEVNAQGIKPLGGKSSDEQSEAPKSKPTSSNKPTPRPPVNAPSSDDDDLPF